jgi:hypothetical protein
MEDTMKLIRFFGVMILVSIFMMTSLAVSSDKKAPAPWTKWEKGGKLDGGVGLKSTKQIPAFDKWYTSEVQTLPMYYVVNVVKDKTYEIYFDDKSEGSGKYTADVIFWVFKMDAKTKYDSNDKGYKEPIKIKAADSTLNIVVSATTAGTFAFGIRQVK